MERVLWLVVLLWGGALGESNHIPGSSGGITSGDELVASVIDSCFDGDDSVTRCVKLHALNYLDHVAGSSPEERRSLDGSSPEERRSLDGSSPEERRSLDDGGDRLDELVLDRVQRFLKNNQFKVQLPEFFFQEATLTFKPSQGVEFDVTFPQAPEGEARAYTEARDMMKEKLLLPLLLLLKLKLKALTPLLVALVGMKALKALILSKISILLVLGFLASQLFKKAGMMSMMPPMTMEPASPMAYGPPAPAAPAPPVTMSSYEPSWEPSQGGPYQRNWEPHQAVYSGYLNHQPPVAPQPISPVTV